MLIENIRAFDFIGQTVTSKTNENWMKNEWKNANRLFFIWNIINLKLKREKKWMHSVWNSYQHERSNQAATTNGFLMFLPLSHIE